MMLAASIEWPADVKATEGRIQEVLYRELSKRGHEPIIPNIEMLSGEADLVSITKAGFVNEFEIKISRSDFKADRKKQAKHMRYADVLTGDSTGVFQHAHRLSAPTQFWYAVPAGLVNEGEVPPHAGLMYVGMNDGFWRLRTVRRAPRLHSERVPEHDMRAIARSFMFRYWSQRLKDVA